MVFAHFLFSRDGDVYEPDGYSLALSLVMVTLIAGTSPEYAARILSLIRRYLNETTLAGENPRAPLEEGAAEAVVRFRRFLKNFEYVVVPSKRANCENELKILVPEHKSTVHALQIVGIFRQFFQLCGSFHVGQRTIENPIEVIDWHKKTEDERRESWNTRHPKRTYGWMNAGLRFRTSQPKVYLPLIEDPAGCGELMTKAVIKYECPASVIAICILLEENGCRWREAAWVNALGWSIKGFGPIVYTTNKFDDNEHAKRIFMGPDVLSGRIRWFQSLPHPADPAKTMMDHLRELAAAGDKAALRRIPLFTNIHGRRHQHRTFSGHWFRPAMKRGKMRTDHSASGYRPMSATAVPRRTGIATPLSLGSSRKRSLEFPVKGRSSTHAKPCAAASGSRPIRRSATPPPL